MAKIDDIRRIMQNSWMTEDFVQDNSIMYATRKNGSVGDEEPGKDDIDHAYKMKKILLAQIPTLDVCVDTVDEWTNILITIK